MEKELDAERLSDIGDHFLTMAQKVNDFRIEKRRLNLIGANTYHGLGKEASQLLFLSGKLKTLSTIWVADETAESLDKIRNITEAMETATNQYKNVQKAILLISYLGKLGIALVNKAPSEIGSAVEEITSLLSLE